MPGSNEVQVRSWSVEGAFKEATENPGADSVDGNRRGIRAILVACLFSSLMGLAFYAAHLRDPGFSSFSGSFIRVLTNLIFVLLPFAGVPRPMVFSPRRHRSLWLWGFFGALTVTTYFAAVARIGSGQAALLSASSGVFIAALSPVIARQRVALLNWIAIAGALIGMYLMRSSAPTGDSAQGALLALGSGLFGALAYLMVARTKSAYSTSTLMLTWCFASIAAHLLIFCFSPVHWPRSSSVWFLLIGAGIAASLNQSFTARAFQLTPATRVAALSYLAPVLSLGFDALVFGISPTASEGLGAAIIVAFGALLPLFTKA